jgi:hypothetical protein
VLILCGFDSQKLHTCGKAASATLKRGRHTLRVAAVDAQDNRSKTTVFRFTIAKK